MSKAWLMVGFAAAILTAACDEGAQREDELAVLDFDIYVADVQAVVSFSCGTLDCHGVAGRPLRIYSVDGLRARDDLRNQPITLEELDASARSFAFVSTGTVNVDDHLALVKPLAETAGGFDHVGGDIWDSITDPGYVCVRAWLAGGSDSAACAAAAPQ